jgi:segregation and condensation protein B
MFILRTAPDLGFLMQRETVETRANCRRRETSMIVAYHQPVTRAEIEEIRQCQPCTMSISWIELKWIRFGRRRMTPGRPVTFVVTQDFLDHLG